MAAFFSNVASFLTTNDTIAYFLRIIIATLCGVLIGLERSKRSKEAGIRTHCIIACASALIMVISKYGFTDLGGGTGFYPGTRGADPARVAAQVVSGISFLGTGVIFKKDNTINGLTTAAGIWATAAVGLACGCGMYKIAIMVTVLVLIIQLLLHKLNIGNDAYTAFEIKITMEDTPEMRAALRAKQEELGIVVTSSSISMREDGLIDMQLKARRKKIIPPEEVMEFMGAHPEIKSLTV